MESENEYLFPDFEDYPVVVLRISCCREHSLKYLCVMGHEVSNLSQIVQERKFLLVYFLVFCKFWTVLKLNNQKKKQQLKSS